MKGQAAMQERWKRFQTFTKGRSVTAILLGVMLFMIPVLAPVTAGAASVGASPIVSETKDTATYQGEGIRTGIENDITVDGDFTGNYQINEVVRVSDGYLFLGFDNKTGSEIAAKFDTDGRLIWSNTDFYDSESTTQIRAAVELGSRLFITGYAGATGFILELDKTDGTYITDSTTTFSGRGNGAATNGSDYIYIGSSRGVYSYNINTGAITPSTPAAEPAEDYVSALAYDEENRRVVAVTNTDFGSQLTAFSSADSGWNMTQRSDFYVHEAGESVWMVKQMNGYLYAIGQDGGGYYIAKFDTNGANLGRHYITGNETDSTKENFSYQGMHSNISSSVFDAENGMIYFLGTANYPNREGNPEASGNETGGVHTPFNTLTVHAFSAGTELLTDEYQGTTELLDLNLHSARGLDVWGGNRLVITGTTQQQNASGDTTNRLFYTTALLDNVIEDKAPLITTPKTLVSYINMQADTGLITKENIAGLLTIADDRTGAADLKASFKLSSDLPSAVGSSDIYFSVTDRAGNKTIATAVIKNEIMVTAVQISGPENIALDASGEGNGAYTAAITPADATNQAVTWSSSDSDIATIDADGNLTALQAGTVTITAVSAMNANVSSEKEITITDPYEVEHAISAVEHAVYEDQLQANVASVDTMIDYVRTVAEEAVSNDRISLTVNRVNYQSALAGTSADPDGSDGIFTFTVTVTNGTESEETMELSVDILATGYDGVSDADAVLAAKNAIVDGAVDILIGSDEAVVTAKVQLYVDAILAQVPEAAGVTAVVTHNGDNNYQAALSKGSVSDHKIIAMDITFLDPDGDAVRQAVLDAESADYTALNQSGVENTDTIIAHIYGIAEAAIDQADITQVINQVEYVPAVEGDFGNPVGTDGVFRFTITLSKNGAAAVTMEMRVVILAAPYIAESGEVTWSDPVTGTTIQALLADGTQRMEFSITALEADSEDYQELGIAGKQVILAYRITPLTENHLVEGEHYTLTFSVDAGLNGTDILVRHKRNDGTVLNYQAPVANGSATIEVDEFSPFVLLNDITPTPTPTPTGTPEEPTPTPTGTPEEPTPTPTGTPEEPTPTPTGTPEEPTPTGTPEEPTPTPTGTPEEPTPTPTGMPEEPTPTPTDIPEESTSVPTDAPKGPTPPDQKPEGTAADVSAPTPKGTDSEGSGKQADGAKTGDTTGWMGYVLVIVTGSIGIVILIKHHKKKKEI